MLPEPFGAIHVLTMIATGTSAAAVAAHAVAWGRPPRPADDALSQFNSVGTRLQGEIEEIQDLRWQVSERESRYRDLLDAQSHVIVRTDHCDRITFVNVAFCELFGVEAHNVLGRPFEVTTAGTADRSFVLGRNSCTPLQGSKSRPLPIATRDGERWFDWQVHELPASQSGTVEFELVGRDVTSEREQQVRLDEARQQAEAASRSKSRFLASMSHEIRTPMNGIIGMSSLLTETELTMEQRTYAQAIERSARVLLTLIDEILDFSKIEAGKLTLRSEPFALGDCVREAVELLAPSAHEKGLELAWLIEPGVPETVVADASRVRQVLLNLLSNAIKFTETGGVLVSVGVEDNLPDRGDRPRRIQFSVKDTGIGLSVEDSQRLFREFEQSGVPGSAPHTGTGLGLSISRRLARAMGGDIHLQTAPGRGSNFSADLPLPPGPECRHGDTAAKEAPDHRTLLAFDKPIEREAMARILSQAGIDVVAVGTEDAAEAVRASKKPFDSVVIAAGTPADEAAALLKSAAKGGRATGVVLTDTGGRSGFSPYEEVGFEAYLTRPVRPAALLKRLVATGSTQQSPMPGNSDKQPAPPSRLVRGKDAGRASEPRLVLIVEDNAINRLLAEKVLERSGHETVAARSGREAISHIARSLQGAARMPDAILMDIFMPGLDGVETTRRIRKLFSDAGSTAKKCPPVIALTAHAFAEDQERYLEAGMDACITKPFEPDDLHRVLGSFLPPGSKTDGRAA